MDRLWVYNAEIFFVDSTHLVAPYIQKQRLKAKKVVLRNTLLDKLRLSEAGKASVYDIFIAHVAKNTTIRTLRINLEKIW